MNACINKKINNKKAFGSLRVKFCAVFDLKEHNLRANTSTLGFYEILQNAHHVCFFLFFPLFSISRAFSESASRSANEATCVCSPVRLRRINYTCILAPRTRRSRIIGILAGFRFLSAKQITARPPRLHGESSSAYSPAN